jgi:hypothetical protein
VAKPHKKETSTTETRRKSKAKINSQIQNLNPENTEKLQRNAEEKTGMQTLAKCILRCMVRI